MTVETPQIMKAMTAPFPRPFSRTGEKGVS